MFGLTDHKGTELDIGQVVAYNYQGQVARGVIKDIAMGTRYGKQRPRIKVEMTHGPDPGHESTVTDQKNLLVINEPAD